MHYYADQMILFAEKRKRESKNKRTYDLKNLAKSAKLDYNIDANIVFTAFNYDKALYIMNRQFVLSSSANACWNKMVNSCRYPVLCGNAIYGVDLGKMVHAAAYLVKDVTTFYGKRYAFNWLMGQFLTKFIPWYKELPTIRYKYYPYERNLHNNVTRILVLDMD